MSFGQVTDQGGYYKIEVKPLPKILEAVKALPERRWDHNNKVWTVPSKHRDEVERFCRSHNVQFGHKPQQEEKTDFMIKPLPELTIDIPLKRDLRFYQRGGVAYIIEKQRLIVGDDMGLGKTFQSLAGIAGLHILNKASFPCLIISPSAVKLNWKKEIEINTTHKGIIMSDAIKNTFMEYYRVGVAQFFIVNYESLKKYFVEKVDDPGVDPETGRKRPLRLNHFHFKKKYIEFFKSVIIDEAHRCKSLKTIQTKIVKGISTGKETVLLLTGTPVINKPKDLVSQLGIIDRLNDLGGYRYFETRYCSGPNEASNLKELNYMLNEKCFYRRNKTDPDIKKYLPDKSRQVIICELSAAARSEYRVAENDLERYLTQYKEASDEQVEKSMKGQVMVKIGILKNIAAKGKLKDAFDYISDVIESGQKIVVFANLKEIIAKVQEAFPRSVRLTGEEDANQKQAAVDRFKNDPKIDLIVMNLKAGGVGVDGLQSVATQVCFIEFGWHAAIMDQAEDRLYRMGQHSNVMCTYFLGKDTIDEWNYELIQTKREIANTITGNEDEVDTNFIDNVMNLFNQKKSA